VYLYIPPSPTGKISADVIWGRGNEAGRTKRGKIKEKVRKRKVKGKIYLKEAKK
jgi:hypothetical protein